MEEQKTIPFFDKLSPLERIHWLIDNDPAVRADCNLVAEQAKEKRLRLLNPKGMSETGSRATVGLIPAHIHAAEWEWFDKESARRAFFKEFPAFRTGKIPPLQPAKS